MAGLEKFISVIYYYGSCGPQNDIQIYVSAQFMYHWPNSVNLRDP